MDTTHLAMLILPLCLVLVGARFMRCGHKQVRDKQEKP